ncbi:hypothetical protein Tco_1515203 [Tanacetum coccineum]
MRCQTVVTREQVHKVPSRWKAVAKTSPYKDVNLFGKKTIPSCFHAVIGKVALINILASVFNSEDGIDEGIVDEEGAVNPRFMPESCRGTIVVDVFEKKSEDNTLSCKEINSTTIRPQNHLDTEAWLEKHKKTSKPSKISSGEVEGIGNKESRAFALQWRHGGPFHYRNNEEKRRKGIPLSKTTADVEFSSGASVDQDRGSSRNPLGIRAINECTTSTRGELSFSTDSSGPTHDWSSSCPTGLSHGSLPDPAASKVNYVSAFSV